MKEFEGYRIILAEDEEIDREVVANLVEDLGATCITVKDGDELLERLNGPDGGSIDLVLTDINMPHTDGIEACSEFRSSMNPKAKTMPIIGISADTNQGIFDRAISAGMNSMTLKPLTRETLRAHFHITLKDNMANAVFSERVQQALAKSLFFSTVSHDLRTPLNAIIGFSEMLKGGFGSREERDFAIDSILMSSREMLQLVNDILDLSKLEQGRLAIEPEPTDVAALLKEIATSFSMTNQNPDLEIFCHVEGLPPLVVDPHRIRQIAFNFVSNAVKFTDRGRIDVRASFSPDPGGGKGVFRIEVEDTGCGISAEDQKKLASPFVQVGDRGSKRAGTGLGLHICRWLAKTMGGSMAISSVLGEGTAISIVLPGVSVASAASQADGDTCGRERLKTDRRILVIDDTKLNQIVLKSMFGRLGVKDVAIASNGREALDLLRSRGADAFDIVLTDAYMPGMGGLEFIKAVRADPALSKMTVYLSTAEVEMNDVYAEKGFDGIILKPVTIESLKELLK